MIGLLLVVSRGAGLAVRAVIFVFRQWVRLCFVAPFRGWWWIWCRSWPLRRKLLIVAGSWVLVALIASVGMLTGREHPQPAVSEAAREPEVRSAEDIVEQEIIVAARGLAGLPLSLSILVGGPAVGVLHEVARRRRGYTVSGRPLRHISPQRFEERRAQVDATDAVFLGASAVSGGAVSLNPETRLMHTWVVGATGTGKTQSVLLPALRSDILAGRPVLFIDGKGDRETLSAVWHLAHRAGRESDFRYFDLRRPKESHSYSPLLNGTPNEQVDKIMAALRWDHEFYRAQSKAALLLILRAMKGTGLPYSLDDVFAALSDIVALRALAEAVKDRDRRTELEPLASRFKEFFLETTGMRSQLQALLMTDFGELLKVPEPSLNLAEAYRSNEIVYFALPVARFPEAAPLVAKLVISDLNTVAGMVQDGQLERKFASIVIDEFAAFAMPLFIDLLNKARSAGIAITISHQSMRGDLFAAGRGFIDQIADNTNVKICLRQSADAEYVASLAGTYKTRRRTQLTRAGLLGHEPTGAGSMQDAEEYRVSPNLIRQLPQGCALVKTSVPEMLDVVVLDRIDASRFPVYEPPPQRRETTEGLDLRRRASRIGDAPTNGRAKPNFDGA